MTLKTQNAEGCWSEIRLGPYIVLLPELFIPNVFSPNADDQNDQFLVEYDGDQPFFLEIRDRWGVVHYQGRNKTKGWDGQTLQGAAANEGVYYYYLRIGEVEYAGELTLMR